LKTLQNQHQMMIQFKSSTSNFSSSFFKKKNLFKCCSVAEKMKEKQRKMFLFCFSVLLVVTKKSGVLCVVRVYDVVLICVWLLRK